MAEVQTQTEVQKEVPVTKASIARRIFHEHFGTLPRKDILKMFQEKAHLTPYGAATYYQKFKKAAETEQGEGETTPVNETNSENTSESQTEVIVLNESDTSAEAEPE